MSGKGSRPRPVDQEVYGKEWERIFQPTHVQQLRRLPNLSGGTGCPLDPELTGVHAAGRPFVWRCERCARLHVNPPEFPK